tara:strand:- start:1043 stop:2167 length:1125 start_codon:yes stop_codon:yes gene_type:complete
MKIPLCIPDIGTEELDAITETISSGWLCHGEKNSEFEEAFKNLLGVDHAISMNSCTSALQLAIECADIRGEIIVPSFTWVASANAIINAKATPIFADINETSFTLNPKSIESLITPSTEAIMPVHYAGQMADMTEIKKIAEKNSLYIVEDSAETIGGEHCGKQAGSFGTGCFSFFPTKNITVGEGGMLTTNDSEIANRVKCVMAHGINKTAPEQQSKNKPWRRIASDIGYNFRLTNFQAAMGVVQMDKLESMNSKRIKNAELYNGLLSEKDNIITPVVVPGNKHVYQMYTIRLKNPELRDSLVLHLKSIGIEASVHFDPPLHQMEPYRNGEYIRADLSVTDNVCESIVTLPMYPQLGQQEIEFICEAILDYLHS